MTLPVTVDMKPDETALSLASALALANGYSSLRLLLVNARMTVLGISGSQRESVEALSSWSGIAQDTLARNSAKSGTLRWRLGDATFAKPARTGNRYRYCPTCVTGDLSGTESDGRPYVRAIWQCREIKTCVVHGIALSETNVPKLSRWDFVRYAHENSDAIATESISRTMVKHNSVDKYLAARIDGSGDEPFLDGFPAFIVIPLCEFFGEFVLAHSKLIGFEPDPDLATDIREVGFQFARKGERKIREVVAAIIDQLRPTTQQRLIYGNLANWLRRNVDDPAFADVIEIFQDEAERRIPFGVGDICIVPVRKRYLHSVHSAGLEYGLDPLQVLRHVREAGLVGATEGLTHARIYFDAAKAHDILSSGAYTLMRTEVRDRLGLPLAGVVELVNAHLLRTVEHVVHTKTIARITGEDVDQLKRKIFADVSPYHGEELYVSIADFRRQYRCTYGEVISWIVDGRLRDIKLLDRAAPTIDGLRIDVSQALLLRTTSQEMEQVEGWVDFHKAARTLGVATQTMHFLLSREYIASRKVPNPFASTEQTLVSKASLTSFQEANVAVGDLASITVAFLS